MVPRLADGRMAMVGKIHHSLVDGIAALQIVGLIVDEPEQGSDGAEPSDEGGRAAPSTTGPLHPVAWAADEAALVARAGLGAARAVAGAAIHPLDAAGGAVRGARGFLEAARTDLLPRAPASPLDTPLSPRRTLVGYHAERSLLRDARAAGGGTLNDLGLAAVAGAVRSLAIDRDATNHRAAQGDGPGEHASTRRGRPG